MKRSWTIQRQPHPALDAENRWDRAFQHLLRCANPVPQPQVILTSELGPFRCLHLAPLVTWQFDLATTFASTPFVAAASADR